MIERRISGAEDPSAMSVRLAIVGFQLFTKYAFFSRYTFFSWLVMHSIAAMKMSATIATPRKHQRRAAR